MRPANWKSKAEAMFFTSGWSIARISEAIGVSTVSVSKHLNSLPHYTAERERRKAQNQSRTEYFRDYKRKCRDETKGKALTAAAYKINYGVCADTIRREHETAVRILSRERHFK